MRTHLFISLFPHENGFHYGISTSLKKISKIIPVKTGEKDLRYLLANLKQKYAKPWLAMHLNFLIPMEKIIIKHFSLPSELNEQEIPLFLKEKIEETFHASHQFYFDFQLEKADHRTFIKAFIIPEDYWKNFALPAEELGTKTLIAEPETQAIYRYLSSYTSDVKRRSFIYISKSKIYFYTNTVKIISSYDSNWLSKSLQYISQHNNTLMNIFYNNEPSAISFKNILTSSLAEQRINIQPEPVPSDAHTYCLGGLMAFNHD